MAAWFLVLDVNLGVDLGVDSVDIGVDLSVDLGVNPLSGLVLLVPIPTKYTYVEESHLKS